MSTAELQSMIRGITYQDLGESPTSGQRAFSFAVTDSEGLISAIAKSVVTVTSVTDLIVAANSNISTNEDTSFTGTYTATDADAYSVSYALGTGAAHGTVSINSAGSYTYTPSTNFNGTDSFTVAVTSRNTQSITGIFNTGVNDDWTLVDTDGDDPHYNLTQSPSVGDTERVDRWAAGSWTPNDANAQWLAPLATHQMQLSITKLPLILALVLTFHQSPSAWDCLLITIWTIS